MKIRYGFICGLLYLATVIASEAITIKISGRYYPFGSQADCSEAFGISIDYDSSYRPEYVQAGTTVSDPCEGTFEIGSGWYLYSLEGIKGFSAFAGSRAATSGQWTGLKSPTDGTDKLWFSSDIYSSDKSDWLYFYGGFFNCPELSINIGDFYGNSGAYVSDISIDHTVLGSGDVKIHIVPDVASTGWLLVPALLGLTFLQCYLQRARTNSQGSLVQVRQLKNRN